MRRILSIFVLFLYLATSIGVTVSLHYCGENLADVSILNQASCCCDEEPSTNDCCSDEIQSLKLHEAHNKSEHTFSFDFVCLTEIATNYIYGPTKQRVYVKIPCATSIASPPDILHGVPIYKRIHSYLFYG